LQGSLFQVDISQIIVRETDEPNAVVDLLYSKHLIGHEGRDIDLFVMDAEAAAVGDDRISVTEGRLELERFIEIY
jgi:hypothetical protein